MQKREGLPGDSRAPSEGNSLLGALALVPLNNYLKFCAVCDTGIDWLSTLLY